MAVEDPLDPANQLLQLVTPPVSEKPASEEALGAIHASLEQARATIEAAHIQADAAIRAAEITGWVAGGVGFLTLLAAGAVVYAARIQAKSIRDQSDSQARSIAQQSRAQALIAHEQSDRQASVMREQIERGAAYARDKQESDRRFLNRSAVAVIVAEIAGHLRKIKRHYGVVIACRSANAAVCSGRHGRVVCPRIHVAGTPAPYFLRDVMLDFSSLKDPNIVVDTLAFYSLLESLANADAVVRTYELAMLREDHEGGPPVGMKSPDPSDADTAWDFIKRSLEGLVEEGDRLVKSLCSITNLIPPDTGSVQYHLVDRCYNWDDENQHRELEC